MYVFISRREFQFRGDLRKNLKLLLLPGTVAVGKVCCGAAAQAHFQLVSHIKILNSRSMLATAILVMLTAYISG